MQDQFFTIRAERYVLPLKASAKSLGLGIVHDTSRTGETVFVEPTALVAVNNRLKVTELEIRRESRRILEAADRRRRGAWPSRCAGRRRRWRRSTRARRRRGWRSPTTATPIEIVEAPIVELRDARHPLLALSHPAAERGRQRRRAGRRAAADPDRQRAERGRQDGADEDRRPGGADGAGRAAGRRRRRAAASASSPTCAPTSAIASR